MKVSNDLFDLIHSLQRGEKRYFTINASQHVVGDSNNYLKLFRAIDKQKSYDEAQLIRQFGHENFCKNFSVTKNYLYNAILKSLEAYEAEKNINNKIVHSFFKCKILHQKGLYHQCFKLLERTKKEAYKYEHFALLLEIFDLEISLMANAKVTYFSDKLHTILEKRKHIMECMRQTELYLQLKCEIYGLLKESMSVRNEEQVKRMRAIMQHPAMQTETEPDSFHAHLHYLSTASMYYYLEKDFEKSYQYSVKIVNLWEQNAHFIKSDIEGYLASVNNFFIRCRFSKRFEEMVPYIQKLKKLKTASVEMEKLWFLVTYSNELANCTYLHQHDKALAIIPEIKKGLKKYQDALGEEWYLMFYVSIAGIYLSNEYYEEALDWVNKILNRQDLGIRKDFYASARLYRLIIYHELKHNLLLEYTSTATYRYLQKNDELFEFEKFFLDFIRKSTQAKNQKEMGELYQRLHSHLESVSDKYKEDQSASRDYFTIMQWVKNKLGLSQENKVKIIS